MQRKENKLKKNLKNILAAGCFLALLLTGCESREDLYVTQQGDTAATSEESAGQSGEETAGTAGKLPEQSAETEANSGTAGEEGQDTGNGQKEAAGEPVDIYVQVSGAVNHPGVYRLPEGSRIFEAVELAGGTTQEADLASVNQAQVLSDGQMIYVYAVGEELRSGLGQEGTGQTGQDRETGDGKVNLNTASLEELMTLPGIGQSKAEAIISWREENGGFDSVEDIMQIQGIKEGIFSRIEDRIKVN